MNSRDNFLFYEGDLDETLRDQLASARDKVDRIPQDQFLNSPEDDVVQHVVSELEVEPLVLFEDRAEMDQRETKIDVSGWRGRNPFGNKGPIFVAAVEVVVSIPYSGDQQLWHLRPSSWQTVFPRAEVSSQDRTGIGSLKIVITQPVDEPPERIKTLLKKEMLCIRFFMESQHAQIEQFNSSLPIAVKDAVNGRRERLKKHEGIQDLLGIPLRQREGAPPLKPIPIKRKLVRPLPPPPKSGFKPEPGIKQDDYEHILSVIRHEGRTFEATPNTYAVHDEEELRDIMLAHLNGHYQGAAAGEAFRRSGKTDIRIEDNGRAAFVAECKVWRGAKELAEAVDQLLGYLTWRDCKAALVIFNKHNARFSELLAKVPEGLKKHPKFRSETLPPGAGEWRYSMTSLEDDGRIIHVHVYLFNLYGG
ncbi:hypothetical protein QQF73_00550 [Marinobacter sp. M216]|uniref:Restriction endonuclease type IV Mrr domain-containing protein n=1 Tax=Marinobacter albus TaxID=3030833 RepID=A0ABT7H6V9_9GAMM|nr:hypothetical protein [Marinobacter sp. M216]MDK9556093.1 hypothetical protein [Marinobacter sp. M216]